MPDALARELEAPPGWTWFQLGIILRQDRAKLALIHVEKGDKHTDCFHVVFVDEPDITRLRCVGTQAVPEWAIERFNEGIADLQEGDEPPWPN